MRDIATKWLEDNNLLVKLFKPPATEAECGYGWSPGEWAEAVEDYERGMKYNEKLISSLTKLLESR